MSPWLLHSGLLWHCQGAFWQLAVQDVCPWHQPSVPSVSQERRRHEGHPCRHQVGTCQLCSVDTRGKFDPLASCDIFVLCYCSHGTFSQLQVSIACPERMEPITKVSHIPSSRWSLICSLCKLKTGACIQVSGSTSSLSALHQSSFKTTSKQN